jgi:hypothetical protein
MDSFQTASNADRHSQMSAGSAVAVHPAGLSALVGELSIAAGERVDLCFGDSADVVAERVHRIVGMTLRPVQVNIKAL